MKYLNPTERHNGSDVVVVPGNGRSRAAYGGSGVYLIEGDPFDPPVSTHTLVTTWAEDQAYGTALEKHPYGIQILQDGIYMVNFQITTAVPSSNDYRRIDTLRTINEDGSFGLSLAVVRSYHPSTSQSLTGMTANGSLTRAFTAGEVLGVSVFQEWSSPFGVYMRRVEGENFFCAALLSSIA